MLKLNYLSWVSYDGASVSKVFKITSSCYCICSGRNSPLLWKCSVTLPVWVICSITCASITFFVSKRCFYALYGSKLNSLSVIIKNIISKQFRHCLRIRTVSDFVCSTCSIRRLQVVAAHHSEGRVQYIKLCCFSRHKEK